MKQTWRWFGPADEITIPEVRQTGAEGIVTALHHVPSGAVWSIDEIRKRQLEISLVNGSPSGLSWDVAESVPVSEQIKSKTGPVKGHLEAYRQSLKNLAECDVKTVCYNFMPVLDWTRTNLASELSHGGNAMRFDLVDFVCFDCFILKREDATLDYSDATVDSARERHFQLDDNDQKQLINNVVAGLPGANDNWTLKDVKEQLKRYTKISKEDLRANLIDFLSEVVPTAEKYGIRLCCHPDDPPFPLLGMPRVMSTETDYRSVLDAVDSPVNGATFCTGSLGVAEDFDPVSFVKNLGSRIHFVHLRNTLRTDPSDGIRHSFYESEHLCGDTDMVATIYALTAEENKRAKEGRDDNQIPMRPDHGHAIVSDLERPMMPGYPLIGRLRGLAELRGVMAAAEVATSGPLDK